LQTRPLLQQTLKLLNKKSINRFPLFFQLFLKQIKPGGLPCYAHVTTATDTNNVKFVFNAIVSIVLEENIRNSGLG